MISTSNGPFFVIANAVKQPMFLLLPRSMDCRASLATTMLLVISIVFPGRAMLLAMKRLACLALCVFFFHSQAGAHPANRIVSLAPVATEYLFALGVGDKIVGVTTFCDRPISAKKIATIGGFADPELEPIIKLKPDLVVATPFGNAQNTVVNLTKLGINTFASPAETLEESKRFLIGLGKATARESKARELQELFDAEFSKLHGALSSLKKPHVLVLISSSPLIAAGPKTFPGEIIAHLGARNTVKTNTPAWPILSIETLIKEPPDFIIVTEGLPGEKGAQASLKPLLSRHPQIKLIVPKQPIFQRPGPYLIDDVKLLLRAIQ